VVRRTALFSIFAAGLFAACGGQDDDPAGASALWDKINAAPGFRSWSRAPGYPVRQPSFTAHANEVEVFVSKEIKATLAGPAPAREWPVGSIVVKEGFSGGYRKLVAVMEKRADGWFWAEYNDDGETIYSGRPSICVDCHDDRKDYSDWVYTFELPR